MSVPIDDDSSAEWYVLYDPLKPLAQDEINSIFMNSADDPDDFAANLGSRENLWGQDRAAMRNGHYSGLTRNIPFEDFIVQSSMGSRLDRTMEQLGSADAILIKVRRMLIEGLRRFEAGEGVSWRGDFNYAGIRARSICYAQPQTWREFSWQGKNAEKVMA
jgi:hypothetical protein